MLEGLDGGLEKLLREAGIFPNPAFLSNEVCPVDLVFYEFYLVRASNLSGQKCRIWEG